MDEREARRRFAAEPVARLATADAAGRPHLVPVTFAVAGDLVVTAVDHKPKRTTALKRLANITANPSVTLLTDHYEDDWTHLWWIRADGTAHVHDSAPEAVTALQAKYPQYEHRPPAGPVILIHIDKWTSWEA